MGVGVGVGGCGGGYGGGGGMGLVKHTLHNNVTYQRLIEKKWHQTPWLPWVHCGPIRVIHQSHDNVVLYECTFHERTHFDPSSFISYSLTSTDLHPTESSDWSILNATLATLSSSYTHVRSYRVK